MEKENFKIEEIDINLDDESIYSEDVRERLLEDDEIDSMEAGFMQGYEEAYV